MEIEGTVHNGVVVLETESPMPDGTRVTMTPQESTEPKSGAAPTILERYKDIVGMALDLPADMAKNHDHYIHGTPKK